MALALSTEQRECTFLETRGKYCVIRACCGAGKTRVLVGAALENPRRRVLILSFNRALAKETSAKLEGHRHVHVMTIHKCASLVYGCTVPDNRTLEALVGKTPMKEEYSGYDLIEFDEGQDVFGVHIQFAALLIAHQRVPPSILIVGDNAQTLYEFLHGDVSKSLLHCERSLLTGTVHWNHRTLNQTQRLTPEMVAFINRYFRHPNDPPLVSAKASSGVLPEVVIGTDRELLSLVEDLIKRHAPGELMILCNSLRVRYFSPVETHLVRRGIPVYNVLYDQGGSGADDEQIERIRRQRRGSDSSAKSEGKVILSTYHRSKGLERPIVVVVGLSASYWCMDKKMHQEKPCTSSPAHVAVTRAMDRLVMFVHSYQGLYPTIPSVDDMRDIAKVRMHRVPADFGMVHAKSLARDEAKANKAQRDKEQGVPTKVVFQTFATWMPESEMTAFANKVRRIRAPDGWWGGGNWDDDGPPESDDAEIEFLSSFDDEVINNAIYIYLTGFECPIMKRIVAGVKDGQKSSFRYHDLRWSPKLNTICLPWTGVKSSAKALELAIINEGLHAVEVGGIGERMRTWEDDPKWRKVMEKGFAAICRRIKIELKGTRVECNVVGINDNDNIEGVVEIVSDGNAVSFTTSDEHNLTEDALRRIMWNTKLHGGAVRVYFLKTYTSAVFVASSH